MSLPTSNGHFGIFGGRFVPEALQAALSELTVAFDEAMADPAYHAELARLQRDYAGRPTPITVASNFSKQCGNATILLKREDLNHTGAHKVNNVLGQALNVARMQLLGAEVYAVAAGSRTLKDAMNEAMRDWVTTVDNTHYLIGTVGGPHPVPDLVRELQRVISTEARAQMLADHGALPDYVAACVGGGSNAIGMFYDFIGDESVSLYGFEAGGDGVETGRHAATITAGSHGVLHGSRTFVLQDEDGQTIESHSISAGLDYPGVGPEHAWLAETGRAVYEPITDDEAMDAFRELTRTEGIIPAIESAHAVAGAKRLGQRIAEQDPTARPTILVCLSGRGDKDVATAFEYFGLPGVPDKTVGGMA